MENIKLPKLSSYSRLLNPTPIAMRFVFFLLSVTLLSANNFWKITNGHHADGTKVTTQPTWESIDAQGQEQWYQDAKLGIFIHWGLYSIPGFCDTKTYSEWYYHWLTGGPRGDHPETFGFPVEYFDKVYDFHKQHYGLDFKYQQFADEWKAEHFDAKEWASIFKQSGAKYVVFVSKHHDGFALWNSEAASESRGYAWNSVQTGPQIDFVGELTSAVKAEDLKIGYYLSLLEWLNPLYKKNDMSLIRQYTDTVLYPQIQDLILEYDPALLWFDGEWDESEKTWWGNKDMLAWIKNKAPNIVLNDRFYSGSRGVHGHYSSTEYDYRDGFFRLRGSSLVNSGKPWEECRSISHSFAINKAEGLDLIQTRQQLVRMLINLVSEGGTLLLNLGPEADGRIPLIAQDRLKALGDWLNIYGDCIYGTTRNPFYFPFSWGRSTQKGNKVYLIVYDWPQNKTLQLDGLKTNIKSARILGVGGSVSVFNEDTKYLIADPLEKNPYADVIELTFDEVPHFEDFLLCTQNADGQVILPARSVQYTRYNAHLLRNSELKIDSKLTHNALTVKTNLRAHGDDVAVVPLSWKVSLEQDVDYHLQINMEQLEEDLELTIQIGDFVESTFISGRRKSDSKQAEFVTYELVKKFSSSMGTREQPLMITVVPEEGKSVHIHHLAFIPVIK